jgi:hypothetical protein
MRKIIAVILFLLMFIYTPFVISKFQLYEDSVYRILQIPFIGLVCILFNNYLGSYTGPMWSIGRFGTFIDKKSSVSLVELLGWFFLFIPFILLLFVI